MNEKFYQYQHAAQSEALSVCGIPFSVTRNEKGAVQKITEEKIPFTGEYEALFFLGMATDGEACSEWWGQWEVFYDHSQRVFIGDRLMRIHVVYDDMSEELISVIFGVNAWNYHLYYKAKDYEDCGFDFGGMFQEPFASDPAAQALKDNSLKLMENTSPDAEKCTKWVFAYRLRPGKRIKEIWLRREGGKASNIAVSAVTGLMPGEPIDPAWTMVDQSFFLRRDYYADMDRLARRLYQFRDDLPKTDPKIEMEDFCAPDITFTGAPMAEVFTNVYRMNIMDMFHNKVAEDGHPRTSSPGSANFSGYMGMGTFKKGVGSYSTTVWVRDVGRTLMELANLGCDDKLKLAADKLHEFMYYPSLNYPIPHWKRTANVLPRGLDDDHDQKENDGHAAIMLFMYSMYRKGTVDLEWVKAHEKELKDAADFFIWQKENPKESNYDKILYSTSEASFASMGGYDVFSNLISAYALIGYSRMFADLGKADYAKQLADLAEELRAGVWKVFGMQHPRYGTVLTDTTDDGWTYEYKRMVDLMIFNDLYGYDMAADDPELFDAMTRTFRAQQEVFYAPESGREMGYGQGYLTQSVIMLDLYEELTECMEAAAMFCYHHSDCNYIVPEGVITHGSKRFWFRSCDQSNGVQQAEIVKCTRLLVGIDDILPERGLRLIPRLPLGWESLKAKDYPVTTVTGKQVPFSFSYKRGAAEGKVTASAADGAYTADWNGDIAVDVIRMGPFKSPEISVSAGKITEVKKIQDNYFAYVKPDFE